MYLFATSTCVVAWNGGRVRLHAGDAWPADDPFVKARGDLFAKDPPIVRRTGAVEDATARPGEKRGGGTRGAR